MADDDQDVLLALCLIFVPFSLTAFGGGISVISAIQHQVVDVYQWLSGPEFLAVFGVSRAAPGPGSMLATLIGWEVAGLPGALVATAAMLMPSSILCLGMAAFWRRYRGRTFLLVIEKAVAPIGAGLLLAGVISLGQLFSAEMSLIVIAVLSSVVCLARPTLHPLIVIGVGSVANLGAFLLA